MNSMKNYTQAQKELLLNMKIFNNALKALSETLDSYCESYTALAERLQETIEEDFSTASTYDGDYSPKL